MQNLESARSLLSASRGGNTVGRDIDAVADASRTTSALDNLPEEEPSPPDEQEPDYTQVWFERLPGWVSVSQLTA